MIPGAGQSFESGPLPTKYCTAAIYGDSVTSLCDLLVLSIWAHAPCAERRFVHGLFYFALQIGYWQNGDVELCRRQPCRNSYGSANFYVIGGLDGPLEPHAQSSDLPMPFLIVFMSKYLQKSCKGRGSDGTKPSILAKTNPIGRVPLIPGASDQALGTGCHPRLSA